MASSSSKQPKEKDNVHAHYSKSTGYEVYPDEAYTKQREIKEKNIYYRKAPLTDYHINDNSLFQIPETDRSRHVPSLDRNFKKSSKYSGRQNINQSQDPSFFKNINNANEFDHNVSYLPILPEYEDNSSIRNGRLGHHEGLVRQGGKEQTTDQIKYGQQEPKNAHDSYEHTNTGMINSELPGFKINKKSSLICKAINYDGEPVVVNDKVIKDKLILSCLPTSYYKVGTYSTEPSNVESKRVPKYFFPPSDLSVFDDVNNKARSDVGYQQNTLEPHPNTDIRRSTLVRSNAIDLGSLGMEEHLSEMEKQGEKYEEQYRAIQCQRYIRNFKTTLWCLFIINTLLVLVGVSLLLTTLLHILFYHYINTVIGHTGYVNWIWAAMVISLMIIFVGTHGIITSINRTRGMLFVYCIIASILIVIIILFLLLFWIMDSNLKTVQHTSMVSTFERYRCDLWVRTGWDNLQAKHHCCGINDQKDWKYIPPSCCQAETKSLKLECINHFIQGDQAFKGGCRTKLDSYFFHLFLLITCLLVLALILLLLGIFAALRLLKMYKVILMCSDMYVIKP